MIIKDQNNLDINSVRQCATANCPGLVH